MNIWAAIYRTSWILLAAIGLVAVGYIAYPRILSYRELRRREAQLAEEIRLDEEMLQALKARQERLQTDPRFVEKIAREELGLAKPGETVFRFLDELDETNATRPR